MYIQSRILETWDFFFPSETIRAQNLANDPPYSQHNLHRKRMAPLDRNTGDPEKGSPVEISFIHPSSKVITYPPEAIEGTFKRKNP